MAAAADDASDTGRPERRLTVARVRERAEHAEVMFYESARIYRLPRTNPAYQEMLRQLQAAAAAGTLVYVRFIQPNGDVIGSIRSD